jgi:4-hydroxyphenylacetate 3-monooxygenase
MSTPSLVSTRRSAPQTGDEYLESLRDGREVWLYGERVADVTTHPAFRNSARSMARLYDALHAPETRDRMLKPTDTGSGGLTHPFFRVARSAQDLRDNVTAIQTWQELVFGWMGRTPDYKAALLTSFGQQPEYFDDYEGNARRWYRDAQENVLFFAHAIANPPVDRNKPIEQTRDVFVHVERETDRGLIVSGAKVVATGSPIAQYVLVGHTRVEVQDKAFALMFLTPVAAPGVKLIARTSYEEVAARTSRPFDYPLSSRLDENDAVLVFEDALIPWENVIIYDETKIFSYIRDSKWTQRGILQANVRLSTKLGFLAGLFHKAAAVLGNQGERHINSALGEMLVNKNLLDGLRAGMIEDAVPGPGGSVEPNPFYASVSAAMGPQIQARSRQLAEKFSGSGLIYLNSIADDFHNPELRPTLDKFYRGSNDLTAVDRSRIMKMLWDAIGSEFGGRHDLYEQNYLGQEDVHYMSIHRTALASGQMAALEGLVDKAMSDYDLNGWTAPDLIGNDDVNVTVPR